MNRSNTRRNFISVVAGLTVLGGIGALIGEASAHGPHHRRPHWRPPPPPARFSAELQSAGGGRLQTFHHRGQAFVLGQHGDRYEIVIRNPTNRRVEAVVTVDGRDVINGRRGDFVRNRGYIVPPFGETRIDGFRQSLSRVAAFRFGDPSDSYSAQMGTPQNVGVIGVAIFRERHHREFADDALRAAKPRAKSAPGRAQRRPAPSSEDAASGLGTEWGEDRTSHVSRTRFVRQSGSPSQVIVLRYDDAAGLRARGIDVFDRFHPVRPARPPQPFPDSGFAPPPPRR